MAALSEFFFHHNDDLAEIDLLIIRVRKNGTPAMAKPCLDCLNNLKKLRIRNVFYTGRDGGLVSEPVATMETDHISRVYCK